jgi:hypothetical protein
MIDGKPQRLNEVLPEIPTNVILNKTVTGCGATYTEIKTHRNSIIVEPNRPVIYGKCAQAKHKDDNLKGVYQGVFQKDIVKYLEKTRREGKFIKIMTTPESFPKVLDALEEMDVDIRFECFVLFDECEKLTKDCDYRQDITLPMDLFFECQNKAMVSATPITELTDPRFKSFKEIKIEPTYNYKHELNLLTTNNVLQVFKGVISSMLKAEKPLFIFINSTDMIHALMNKLSLVEQSAVFCSEKSVDKLKQLKFKAAYEDWDNAKMKQVNWMTSRFYSALDIELDEQPNVLMLTDVYIAQWTMFDPFTDSVQVVGRFRNGVSSFTHISNYDYRIPYHARLFFQAKCECDKSIYESMTTFYKDAPTDEYRAAYYDVLQVLPYKKFLKEDGQVNYFKIDNYIDEELTKVYYGGSKRLFEAYEQGKHFNVKFDNIKPFKVGDFERLRIEDKSISLKEKRKRIVEQLEMLGECETEADMQYKRDLRTADAFIVDAYDQIGKSDIEKYKYSVTKIKEAIIIKCHREKSSSRDVLELINLRFKEGLWYSRKYIKTNLDEIYTKMEIPRPRAVTSGNIREYFTAVEKNKKNSKGYLLLTRKFEC